MHRNLMLLVFLVAGCATQVELSSLFSSQDLAGSIVSVEGYVSLDFEGNAIYEAEADCLSSSGAHLALELQASTEARMWSRCQLSEVSGIFDPSYTGHFGMSPLGGIVNVSRVRGIRAR